MKLKIVGSGGMFQIPNPFCGCPVCEEARIKRGRYERLGPSLYIEDIKMLIDTPEDIGVACDRQGISEIRYLSISHKDPTIRGECVLWNHWAMTALPIRELPYGLLRCLKL